MGSAPLVPLLHGLGAEFLDRSRERGEQIAIGAGAHQGMVVILHGDFGAVLAALLVHHHMSIPLTSSVQKLGKLGELRVQLLLDLGRQRMGHSLIDDFHKQ